MRVAVVNDLRMAVEVLRRVVSSLPGAEVVWTAENGQEAVDHCRKDRPDLILMDMIMPVMDGVEATRRIMLECPCPILVTTASVKTNVSYVYEALGHGAMDAVNTPVLGTDGSLEGAEHLIRRIRLLAQPLQPTRPGPPGGRPSGDTAGPATQTTPPLVAIGASTGGPQALRTVLTALPNAIPYAVVIVQHLDERFVPGLAEWLDRESRIPVRVVEPGRSAQAGSVWIACTADHLVLDPHGRMQYAEQPRPCIHRPAVDVFFTSLAGESCRPGVAVLLTGMGQDGASGLKTLRDRGWETIAQDKPTSVVWGMPGAAVRLNAARHVLPIEEIGPTIDRIMRREIQIRRFDHRQQDGGS
jgi:two-component system response regulator WspF